MKKLDDFLGQAPKIKGDGVICYEIWYDKNGALYVRMNENEIDTEKPGTFSGLLYSVSRYMNVRNSHEKLSIIEGYDLETSKLMEAEDNNNGGFLKAVLRHLLPASNQKNA